MGLFRRSLSGDTSKYFVDNIPYRTKFVNLTDYLKTNLKSDFYENLINECNKVINNTNLLDSLKLIIFLI